MRVLLAALLLSASFKCATAEGSKVNPVRRVVTMLQMMQKKVSSEGEKEKELFDKYMCWCDNGAGALGKSIADAGTKSPELESAIQEAEAQKKQLQEDLERHQADRAAAKKAIADATNIREKEAAEFAKFKSEADSNINALEKAVAALDKGMSGGFLQTTAASVLKNLVNNKDDMQEYDRRTVMAFLSGSSDYSPASGEIVGILKQMGDEMQAGRSEAVAAEETAIKGFNELVTAKKKEIAALTKSIETKLERVGALGIEIAQMKNELGDTQAAMLEDKKFLADMEANCAKKKAEWDERVKMRAQELVALADTIKILNDDDALELFKKTLPSAASSLLQVQESSAAMRASALSHVENVPGLEFIALALHGKKIGFEKVIKMIDDLVVTLKQEQLDDDSKKEYCASQFDLTDDKKKELERSLSNIETAIENAKESIDGLTADIKSLNKQIKELDKSVAEATEQRKEEHEDYKELMASNGAAKELLGFAKNRLNKFYNPKLYKPPPKRELSEEDRITVNMGGTLAPTAAPGGIAGTGVTVLVDIQSHDSTAPPPPPETFGAYTKKSEDSGGVIAMIDLLVKDLDKEMTEAEAEEKNAQSDYESMMSDSAEKRAQAATDLTDREADKAKVEEELQKNKEEKASTGKELEATLQYIKSLHGECDWLLEYFDVRKEARTAEIDALGKAKAVLSGADYSLLQRSSLRGRK